MRRNLKGTEVRARKKRGMWDMETVEMEENLYEKMYST